MNNTRHLGSYGLIIDNDKIVLVRKSRGAYIGKLDLPGGSFEHGETPLETVIREIKEEVGVNVTDAKLFDANSVVVDWVQDGIPEHMHHIGFFYLINVDNNSLKQDSDGLDSLGASWYSLKELKKEDVSPLTFIEINKYLNDNH